MLKLSRLLVAGGLTMALACCGGSESPSGAGGSGGTGGTGASSSSSTGAGASSSSSSGDGGSGGSMSAEPVLTADVSPKTVVAGSQVTVTVSITNFEFVAAGGPNVDGEGHYHVYLDGATGGNYLANGETPTKKVKIPAGTAPGPHKLRVSVSDNNHAPLVPAVEVILDITVQ